MGDDYPKSTVAAAHVFSGYLDREATVDKAVDVIEEAADNGVPEGPESPMPEQD